MRAHCILHSERRLEDRLGVAQVALASEGHHCGPRRGEQTARTRPFDSRRAVLPARPRRLEEVLAVAQLLVSEQQQRRALQAVAVLVRVGRDRGHTREAEVERWDVVAELLTERQDESAEATV